MEESKSAERLLFLKSFIGKQLENSPSPYMNWLKPTVLIATAGTLKFSYVIRND